MKLLLLLLSLFWHQDEVIDVLDIRTVMKQLDQGVMKKESYNSFIDKLSKKIATSNSIDTHLNLALSSITIGSNMLVERFGTSLSSQTMLLRKNLINQKYIRNSMLALAMNNDVLSIEHFKKQLLDPDFYAQFVALESLAIMSLFDIKYSKTFENTGQTHWFIPINKVTKTIVNYLKNFKGKVTPWEIYQLHMKMEDVFWQEVYKCNLVESIDEIGITLSKIKPGYLKMIEQQSIISLKNTKLLAENQNQFKALIQSYNKLILIDKNNNAIEINTMATRAVLAFNLGKRNFLIFRGLDSISFDWISELLLIDGRYVFKSKFKLPYSTRKIHDKKKAIIIDGNTWKIKINKEKQLIEKAILCNESKVINIKI